MRCGLVRPAQRSCVFERNETRKSAARDRRKRKTAARGASILVMPTQTVWVQVTKKVTAMVPVDVPAELGGMSAAEEAEASVARRDPNFRIPADATVTWSYYADNPKTHKKS